MASKRRIFKKAGFRKVFGETSSVERGSYVLCQLLFKNAPPI